jgi:DNA-binding transcriptional regulator YiaG
MVGQLRVIGGASFGDMGAGGRLNIEYRGLNIGFRGDGMRASLPGMGERDHGMQPVDRLMEQWGLGNHDLVDASTEQLNHKQVQKARKGRQLTLNVMQKVTRGLNIAIWFRLSEEEREGYFEYMHKHFCAQILQTVLRVCRPKTRGYPIEVQQVGDHLKAKRMDLGCSQPRLAGVLQVTVGTLQSWESGDRAPMVRNWPRIIEFLGYDPTPCEEGIPGMLRQWRRRAGLTIRRAAAALGVQPGTWTAWELSAAVPTPDSRRRINALLARPA